ncbi:hypothetical protein FS749_008296 [Ceratobasidium sp. UAMH 11750]|nr:hypothetical protein FS749_008296 [Ceratobasidium sp. UAMH 11750]
MSTAGSDSDPPPPYEASAPTNPPSSLDSYDTDTSSEFSVTAISAADGSDVFMADDEASMDGDDESLDSVSEGRNSALKDNEAEL